MVVFLPFVVLAVMMHNTLYLILKADFRVLNGKLVAFGHDFQYTANKDVEFVCNHQYL